MQSINDLADLLTNIYIFFISVHHLIKSFRHTWKNGKFHTGLFKPAIKIGVRRRTLRSNEATSRLPNVKRCIRRMLVLQMKSNLTGLIFHNFTMWILTVWIFKTPPSRSAHAGESQFVKLIVLVVFLFQCLYKSTFVSFCQYFWYLLKHSLLFIFI